MTGQRKNEFGQPIGAPLPDWSARPVPPHSAIEGRFCRVEPLDPERHATDLFAANSEDVEGRNWTYLPYGPFRSFELYRGYLARRRGATTRLVHAIVDRASGHAVGVASLMRIDPVRGRDRGRRHQLQSAPAAPAGSDRGDVSADAPGFRRTRLPPLRVEMRTR